MWLLAPNDIVKQGTIFVTILVLFVSNATLKNFLNLLLRQFTLDLLRVA